MKKCSYLDNFIRLAKLLNWNEVLIKEAEFGQQGLVYLPLDKTNKEHVKYSKITTLDYKIV